MFFLITIGSIVSAFSQEANWQLKNEIQQSALFFNVDKLSNIYLLSEDILTQYSVSNTKYSQKTYKNQKYASIESIDVSNPFQILLFYKEYQIIIILDNNLSLVSEISIRDLGIEEAGIVCSAKEGGFWVFDEVNMNFHCFDFNLNKTKESLSIDLMFDDNYHPIFMLEKNNQLYVSTSEKEILIFDPFANFNKLIPLSIDKTFLVEETINYFDKQKNKIFFYNPISFETKEIDLSWKKNIVDAQLVQKKLYIFTPKGISVFER